MSIARTKRGGQALGSRRYLLTAIVSMVALLLAACGDGDAASNGDEGAATEDTTTSADESPAAEASAKAEAAADGGDCSSLDLSDAEAFYEGSTIRYVVPYGPGGGNDTYAREFAPFVGEELGAEVVVENVEGGGGLVGINQWAGSGGDGSQLIIFSATGQIINMLAGLPEIEFTGEDLHWLGAFAGAPQAVSAVRGGDFASWEAVLGAEDPVPYGSVGPGGTPFYTWGILQEAFPEFDGRPVRGFSGSSEQELAMLSGDIAMIAGSIDPFDEESDFINTLVFAPERLESQPDVPTIFEFDISPEAEELATVHAGIGQVHRPIIMHADAPQDRKCLMENAVREALQSPELAEALERGGRQFDPLGPDEAAELADEVLNNIPQSYIDFVTELAQSE